MVEKTANDKPTDLSRRELIKQAGLAATAVAVSGTTLGCSPEPATTAAAPAPAAAPVREALETLNAAEADALEAIVARLIPSDENGPGAKEARAAHYIDRALAGPLRALRANYANGLATLDEYAQATYGVVFAKLGPEDQDSILTIMEANSLPTFANSSAFFNLVRTHTIEGTFSDPYYGGNVNYAGWNLIGYPGIRMGVTADDQRMKEKPQAIRKSAYDDPMFAKAGGDHGHEP